MSENTEFNLDALLEGTLDDLADMPEFKPYPAGTHQVSLRLEKKVVNNHPGFECKIKLIETKELANTQDVAPAAGAETSILYLLDNEIGQGQFKKLLAAASEKFGAKKNSALIEDIQNAEALIVTRVRQNKDKTQSYTDIVEAMFI